MRRASTTVVLGGWTSFLLTLSIILFYAVLTLAEPAIPPLPFVGDQVARDVAVILEWGRKGVLAAAAGSFAGVAIAIVLAMAVFMLRGEEADRTAGERTAALGLVAAGTLLLGLREAALFDFDSLLGFLAVVALSLAAIAFDRLIEIEEPPNDDEDFHAAAIRLGQEMARNVVRNPAATEAPRRDGTS